MYQMKTNLQSLAAAIALAVIFLSSCSKDKPATPDEPVIPVKGVYIMNEGSFTTPGSSSLSFLDFTTKEVTKDIFSANNKDHSLGNGLADMDIYGSLLFITATESNKVEILNASTAQVLKTITVEKPRFIAFYKGKAFITTYLNKVVVIDTLTNAITGEINVGRTPEHIVTLEDKLYVANSGSHDAITGQPEGYDNTISIINPNSLAVEDEIEVADNVYNLFTDGNVLFANTGDVYEGVYPNSTLKYPSKLYKIDIEEKRIDSEFDFGVTHMVLYQGGAIFISNNKEAKTKLYTMSLTSLEPRQSDLIKVEDLSFPYFPYALSVDPENGDLWYAKSDFGFDGTVYHYKNGNNQVTEYTVGLNPSTLVFR